MEAPNITTKHNTELFDTWTEESAYMLGYLEADGYIKYDGPAVRVYFQCSGKDISFLKKLKKTTKFTGKLGRSDNWIGGKKYEKVRFTITSRRWNVSPIFWQLKKECIPLTIPQSFTHHYIRGYFDGDGSIYWDKQAQHMRSSFVFSSTGLAESFAALLRRVVGAKLTVHKKTSSDHCWYFQLGNKATEKLVKYMYRDANIYLERKHELASELL
jgi:hypothetical protein